VTLTTDGTPQRLANVLKNAGLVASTSDGNRMIDQGAVRLGDSAETLTKVVGRDHALPAGKFLIQVGKHKFRWVALQQD
jgi:tyrosyl-tRNA synthetase